MTTRLPRIAAGLVLLAAVAVPAGPARAAGLPGVCPDADGVTVVVDFQELGGQTLVRCAPGPQPTGLAALKNAGITIAGTARWGEAFICRVEGRPGVDTEPCVDTPPASAYWSYWHATDRGAWTYSQLGVANRTPPPGSFEGWSFALDAAATGAPPPQVEPRRPAPAPTSPPAPRTRPADPPRAPPPPAGDQPRDPGPAAGGTGPLPGPGPAAATPAPPVPTATAGTAAGAATAGPATPPPASSDIDNQPTRPAAAGAGVPVGTLTGLGLLLALTVAAAVTGWRRRRAPAGPSGPDG